MSHLHNHLLSKGKPLEQAEKAMILVHGRGATAKDIMTIADLLHTQDFALLAPQAERNTWYPYSFMAPAEQNEPELSQAMDVIDNVVQKIKQHQISDNHIYYLGFSQGACLISEYLVRNARKYGGAFIFSGGLIGQQIDNSNYTGNFENTDIIIGCSNIDPHIPLTRVKETTVIFRNMGANVTERIYPGGPHSVFEDEIEMTNHILAQRPNGLLR